MILVRMIVNILNSVQIEKKRIKKHKISNRNKENHIDSSRGNIVKDKLPQPIKKSNSTSERYSDEENVAP